MTFRYGSVCSGIEAASVAWKNLPWECAFLSEIATFPRKVLQHHYPTVPLHGDFSTIKGDEYGKIDLLIGGTPCFPKEVTVLTSLGLTPISEVKVGDLVLTHKGRWRKVLATGAKFAQTVILKGQGHWGLETTEDHPFYSRSQDKEWNSSIRNCKRVISEPSWVPASEMKKKFWATPSVFPECFPPPVSLQGNEKEPAKFSDPFFWVVGRWLADGWTHINERRGYAIICSSKLEAEEMKIRLTEAGFSFSQSEERTTARFQIASRAFAQWLRQNFGQGDSQKIIPSWCFGMCKGFREQLLAGYISGDGHQTDNGFAVTTTSKNLAISVQILGKTLGMTTSVQVSNPKRICFIEGRQVKERAQIRISFYNASRSSFFSDNHCYGLVRSVVGGSGIKQVFNIEVEEDNSYVADGITVHNCQSFSIAGLRKGLDDERGNLSLEFIKLVKRTNPKWIIWENVPGVLSSTSHNAPNPCPPPEPLDLECEGQEMVTEEEYDSEELHAFNCFLSALSECGYGIAYRILDSQNWGVPQRRRRVFVVGYLGDWRAPASILFESESLRGNIKKIKEKRKDIAGTLTTGFGSRGIDSDQIANGNYAIMKCLTARGAGGGNMDPETANFIPCYGIQSNIIGRQDHHGGNGLGIKEQQSPTLTSADRHAVCFDQVRRLTPIECEKLQGFPKDYTKIDDKTGDSPRYTALGNSMAVPVIRWLGERIEKFERIIL